MHHTRQREWQITQRLRNRCTICGKAALYRDERCLAHYTIKVMRKAGFYKLDPHLLDAITNQLRNEKNYWRRYWARLFEAGDM